MSPTFFAILFLSSFIPRMAGFYLAKRSTQSAWVPNSVFSKLGAYVLIMLAVISCLGTFAEASTVDAFFATALIVVVVMQMYFKNPLISFSIGFLVYMLLSMAF